MNAVLVLAGGAAGALLRWWVGELLGRRRGVDLPWATVVVNAAGALALGVLAGAHVTGGSRLLLGTGVCGALTTFSAFSYDVVALGERRRIQAVALLVALHATVCLAAVWAGVGLGSLR